MEGVTCETKVLYKSIETRKADTISEDSFVKDFRQQLSNCRNESIRNYLVFQGTKTSVIKTLTTVRVRCRHGLVAQIVTHLNKRRRVVCFRDIWIPDQYGQFANP